MKFVGVNSSKRYMQTLAARESQVARTTSPLHVTLTCVHVRVVPSTCDEYSTCVHPASRYHHCRFVAKTTAPADVRPHHASQRKHRTHRVVRPHAKDTPHLYARRLHERVLQRGPVFFVVSLWPRSQQKLSALRGICSPMARSRSTAGLQPAVYLAQCHCIIRVEPHDHTGCSCCAALARSPCARQQVCL